MALGAQTLRESEGSQNDSFGAGEASPPASEASDEPRSGEQVAINAAHNTDQQLHIRQTKQLHITHAASRHIRQNQNKYIRRAQIEYIILGLWIL